MMILINWQQYCKTFKKTQQVYELYISKVYFRKLKNRVAAQSARDKKKARMDDLESIVKTLEKKVSLNFFTTLFQPSPQTPGGILILKIIHLMRAAG